MKAILNLILSNWSVMRFLRLFLALSVVYYSTDAKDYLFAGLGLLMVVQTLLVPGCGMGTTGCVAQTQNQESNLNAGEVQYEEIKGK